MKKSFKQLEKLTMTERIAHMNMCFMAAEEVLIADGHRLATKNEVTPRQKAFAETQHPELGCHAWVANANGYMMHGINVETMELLTVNINPISMN